MPSHRGRSNLPHPSRGGPPYTDVERGISDPAAMPTFPTFDEAVPMPRTLSELRSFIGWLTENAGSYLEGPDLTEDELVALINRWRRA